MRLYIGNLSREVTEEDLTEAFKAFGKLSEVSIARDKFNNTPKGFAFIEMPSDDEAKKAIAGLSGTDLKGRNMDVNEARPRTERAARGNWRGGKRF
jgi:RNA recognition motif-containing protein